MSVDSLTKRGMHEEVLVAECSKEVRVAMQESYSYVSPQRGVLFSTSTPWTVWVFSFRMVPIFPPEDFRRLVSRGGRTPLPTYLRWFMLKNIGRTTAETEKPTQSLFHCSVFRDGRDYGRITLHNMDAPNQIKAETIKARVKATAVSSFICLPPPPHPSKSVALNSTVSIPDLSSPGADISPLLHERWTGSGPDINPSKQSKQGSKAPMIIYNLSRLTVKLM